MSGQRKYSDCGPPPAFNVPPPSKPNFLTRISNTLVSQHQLVQDSFRYHQHHSSLNFRMTHHHSSPNLAQINAQKHQPSSSLTFSNRSSSLKTPHIRVNSSTSAGPLMSSSTLNTQIVDDNESTNSTVTNTSVNKKFSSLFKMIPNPFQTSNKNTPASPRNATSNEMIKEPQEPQDFQSITEISHHHSPDTHTPNKLYSPRGQSLHDKEKSKHRNSKVYAYENTVTKQSSTPKSDKRTSSYEILTRLISQEKIHISTDSPKSKASNQFSPVKSSDETSLYHSPTARSHISSSSNNHSRTPLKIFTPMNQDPFEHSLESPIIVDSPVPFSDDNNSSPMESVLDQSQDKDASINSFNPPPLTDDDDAIVYARKCFDEDLSFLPREKVAEWLSRPLPLHERALHYYLNHFDFSDMKLEQAFRYFCSRLYLVGESQAIDRILIEFARRYWECNPHSGIQYKDTIYAIVYSTLLLNTDLHVAQNNDKLTRSKFIKNTLATIKNCIELNASGLKNLPPSEIPNNRKSSANFTRNNRNSQQNVSARYRFSLFDNEKNSYGLIGEDVAFISAMLKSIYSNIKHHRISLPGENDITHRASTSSLRLTLNTMGLTRSKSVTAVKRLTGSNRSRVLAPLIEKQDSLYSLESSNTEYSEPNSTPGTSSKPYFNSSTKSYKSLISLQQSHQFRGILSKKHLYERTDRKAHQRSWKECYVVVERGEFKMFRSEQTVNQKEDEHFGQLCLRHSLANALPTGYSLQRPYVFALELPNGAVYLFQASSETNLHQWVTCCNYWAARESKEPLTGSVTNVDYGWLEDPIHDSYHPDYMDIEPESPRSPTIHIQDWEPPHPPMVRSMLDEPNQLKSLFHQIQILQSQLEKHQELRSTIDHRFGPKNPNKSKAFANWERKSQYLLRELIKYQNYADSLKTALLESNNITDAELSQIMSLLDQGDNVDHSMDT